MTDPGRWLQYSIRDLTVGRVLERQAAERGDKVYLRSVEGDALTYAEVYRATNRIARWLVAQGLGKGAHVAVMMDARRDCLLAHIALAKLGAVSIPINTSARGGMLAHFINFCDAVAVITEPEYVQHVVAIENDLPLLNTLIVAGEHSPVRSKTWRFLRLADSANAPDAGIEVGVKFSDLAFIMFTSGTTGPSKGVMFPQARAFLWDEGVVSDLGINEMDTYFVCTPLSHATGLFSGAWMMMALGASVALAPRFSASQFWDQVRATRSTFTTLLGAMVSFLENQPERKDDANNPMRMISTGPYPKNWRAIERRFGLKLVTGYGLTDHSAPTKLKPDAPAEKRGSAGCVIDAFDMMIVDEDDMSLPPGQIGECVLRSRLPWHSSAGYYKLPEQTRHSRRNEWFHTGDRGYLDSDGYFWFVDRAKDVIRRLGENISAFEVEQFAGAHPAVAEIAAYPVRADESEEEVAVSIVLKPRTTLDPRDLIRHCLADMPKYMVPRFVHLAESLPRNLNMRVEKYKLREWAEKNRALIWDRETDPEFRRVRPSHRKLETQP
jgi:crotonobetaine/carnitine-CoA ligase